MPDVYPTTLIGLCAFTLLLLAGLVRVRWEQIAASKRDSATASKIAEMHEQVRNDHPQQPNLRHDLDLTRDTAADVHAIVRDMQDRQIAQDRKLDAMSARLHDDVTGIRKDLSAERERSISVDSSLWRAIQPLLKPE